MKIQDISYISTLRQNLIFESSNNLGNIFGITTVLHALILLTLSIKVSASMSDSNFKYPIVEKLVGDEKELRRVITFNKERDLKYPPDKRKVLALKDKFEGTIFAGSFIIDKKYLLKSLEKTHDKNN